MYLHIFFSVLVSFPFARTKYLTLQFKERGTYFNLCFHGFNLYLECFKAETSWQMAMVKQIGSLLGAQDTVSERKWSGTRHSHQGCASMIQPDTFNSLLYQLVSLHPSKLGIKLLLFVNLNLKPVSETTLKPH